MRIKVLDLSDKQTEITKNRLNSIYGCKETSIYPARIKWDNKKKESTPNEQLGKDVIYCDTDSCKEVAK